MIALQVSHSLQFPWNISRSLVKIDVNQFSPVTDVVPFSFSVPVVFVGSLFCSLLDVPLMQCSCPTGIRHFKTSWSCFQNKLNLFWRCLIRCELALQGPVLFLVGTVLDWDDPKHWPPKIEMVFVINRWRVKPRLRQTRNCSAWPTFPFYSFRLLFIISTWKFFFSRYVHRSDFFWTVFTILNMRHNYPFNITSYTGSFNWLQKLSFRCQMCHLQDFPLTVKRVFHSCYPGSLLYFQHLVSILLARGKTSSSSSFAWLSR